MIKLQNNYISLANEQKQRIKEKTIKHPLFGYCILVLTLMVIQLLFIFTEGIIPLNISQAIMQTMIYVIAGLGVGILLMLAGLISFATGAFIGLGTYIAAFLLKNTQIPFILILAAVVAAGVVIGIIVGFISLRVRGMHLIIITIALATVLFTLYALPNAFTGGPLGVSKVPFPKLVYMLQTSRDTIYFVVLGMMFLLIVLTLNIINSPIGRAMLSMSGSEALSQAMGIRILKYRVGKVFAMIQFAEYQ